MQRSLILLQGNTMTEDDLVIEDTGQDIDPVDGDEGLQSGLREREQRMILDALDASHGNRTATAKALGISPRTLRYKLARMRDAGVAIPGERPTRTETGNE